jgi:hypothetical protein
MENFFCHKERAIEKIKLEQQQFDFFTSKTGTDFSYFPYFLKRKSYH